ncbi:MAG: hypothetical protein DMG07_26800 [Acidobacteria bacterium]|nr:MAG: hypothetical protein DMG07_26800 [Acidobacteriota bacterium]
MVGSPLRRARGSAVAAFRPPVSRSDSRQPLTAKPDSSVNHQYQRPTGYPDGAEQWVNTGALLERLNFALALASNRVDGTAVDLAAAAGGARAGDADAVMRRALTLLVGGEVSPETRALLVRQLNEKVEPKPKTAAGPDVRPAPMEGPVALQIALFGGDPRFGGRTWRKPDLDTAQVDPQVARAFGLVLGSPDFQRR